MNKELLKEHRTHGTKFFPVGTYKNHRHPGEDVLDFHWHEEWEFFLITQGSALLQTEDQLQPVTCGQAMFAQNRAIHGGRALGDEGCSYEALVFHPRLLADSTTDAVQTEYIEPFLNGKQGFPCFILNGDPTEEHILQLLQDIFQLCEKKPLGYELHTKGNLLLIWAALLESGRFTRRTNLQLHQKQVNRLKAVLRMIDEEYQHHLTVRQLAVRASMSESYFCRFFKRSMHMTPVEYIQRYRIRMAAHALTGSDSHIIEIAYNCGFDNLSYFNQLFKKYMNCTPTAYRCRS